MIAAFFFSILSLLLIYEWLWLVCLLLQGQLCVCAWAMHRWVYTHTHTHTHTPTYTPGRGCTLFFQRQLDIPENALRWAPRFVTLEHENLDLLLNLLVP